MMMTHLNTAMQVAKTSLGSITSYMPFFLLITEKTLDTELSDPHTHQTLPTTKSLTSELSETRQFQLFFDHFLVENKFSIIKFAFESNGMIILWIRCIF